MPEALAYQENKIHILIGESQDGRVMLSVTDETFETFSGSQSFKLMMSDPVVLWLIKALAQTRAIVEDRRAKEQLEALAQKEAQKGS